MINMENLNLNKFSPKEAELRTLANKAEGLEIKGIEDKAGYDMVHTTRMELKNARVEVTKSGKLLREEANAFAKAVIVREKELIAIIEPVEEGLEAKEKAIDEEKARIKRQADLPIRMEKLKGIEAEATEDEVLGMDDKQFTDFFMVKTEEYVAKKQEETRLAEEAEAKRIQDEADRQAEEQRKLAEQRRLDEAKRQAEKEAKANAEKEKQEALKKAEEDKQKAIEDERKKAEAEKQKILDDQKAKDDARIAQEKKVKEEAEAKAKAEKEAEEQRAKKAKEEEERLEKVAKYKKFLADLGYSEETKDDFRIEQLRHGDKIAEINVYKLVGTFKN